ncbi:hypothetical protein EDF88_3937 [Buttiauxella sp. BIGb0552]|nr:hypothetical protein EDF88_3937 [Buttiauxella sp. BIGb0552]
MKDTRNWKCFFGMHQWQQLNVIRREYYEGHSSGKLPYKITNKHTLKCCHCGELKSVEM